MGPFLDELISAANEASVHLCVVLQEFACGQAQFQAQFAVCRHARESCQRNFEAREQRACIKIMLSQGIRDDNVSNSNPKVCRTGNAGKNNVGNVELLHKCCSCDCCSDLSNSR